MSQILEGHLDRFNGITVTKLPECSVEEFKTILKASLEEWEKIKMRGLWVQVGIKQSNFISVLAESGFIFHHAKEDHVVMTRWLPKDEPNKLPLDTATTIGVGGFVLNDKNEILVVKEKFMENPQWKFPGGMADLGEDISVSAVREVREETNIQTEFVSIICIRSMHNLSWGRSNIYIVARLKPITHEIKMETSEILDCKWMPLDDFINDPNTTTVSNETARIAKENMKMTNGNPTTREFTEEPILSWNKKDYHKFYKCGKAKSLDQ